eukprot:TRINITY_DN12524_c0_g4_i14.p2 TRINITY_DN12524_c0_g4~~TRINITY_DN12524_c0_g4_i14.p2  ORF type:complete len:425 (+),score=75.29 TRINITY_DN12524_c0_g4_i14:2943-4217(+)
MSDNPWTLHPFLEPGSNVNPNLWYIIPTDDSDSANIGPRIGNTVVDLGQELVFFGGATPDGLFNDVHRLKKSTLKWIRSKDAAGVPSRYDHGAFVNEHSNQMCIIGGCVGERSDNAIIAYNHENETWRTCKASTEQPSSRTHHAVAQDTSACYVVGGGHSGTDPVDDMDVYSFTFGSSKWQRHVAKGSKPCPRQGHGLVLHERCLYLFGGMAQQQCFDDLWRYNLDSHEWNQLHPTGPGPCQRSGHTFAALGDELVVFGGMTLAGGNPSALADVWTLRPDKLVWQEANLDSAPIAARFDCASCVVSLDGFASSPSADPASTKATASPTAATSDPLMDVTAQFGAVIDGIAQDIPDGSVPQLSSAAVPTPIATDSTAQPPSTKADEADKPSPEGDCSQRGEYGLLVFGGMDLIGNVHGDCALLRL